jgi:CRP/FNR family transcriptional regulator, cyclic AMP receptor protein
MQHADLLAQISLFEGLSDDDLNALAERLSPKAFSANAKVFSKGENGSSMYIVLSGAVQIFLPGEGDSRVALKDARTGEYFGELSLFDDKPRSASVETVVETVLLELTRENFADHLARSRTAALSILSDMAERLRETNALLSQRAARDVVKEIEENLTWGQRLADRVAELNGSWAFMLFLIGLTFVWALANKIARNPFDEYPFQFYNLALAILVALQGPLIVMSQNRQTLKDRAQAETDFRVNLKNELGIERIQSELGAFRAEMTKRIEVLDRSVHRDRIRSEMPAKIPGGPLESEALAKRAVSEGSSVPRDARPGKPR